jgi:hypothetical protein
MFENFTESAIKVLMLSQEEARRMGHNFVEIEDGDRIEIDARAIKKSKLSFRNLGRKVVKTVVNKLLFKKIIKKLRRKFITSLLICSLLFTVTDTCHAQPNFADAFPQRNVCPRRPPSLQSLQRQHIGRAATGLGARLKNNNPNEANQPRPDENKDRYVQEFDCVLKHDKVKRKFKHAKVFGIDGNPTDANLELFKDAIIEHMKDPSTEAIKGRYRHKKPDVIYYYNEEKNLTVFVLVNATTHEFTSAWNATERQQIRMAELKQKGE